MKRILSRIIIYSVLFAGLFSSCITPRKVNYMQPPGMGIPAYRDSVSYEDYRIKIDDRLYLRVYSIDDRMNSVFNGLIQSPTMINDGSSYQELYTYLVEDDGGIMLPYLGKVYVEGKTVREAKYFLEEELSPYFKFETIDVDVRISGKYYSIVGQSSSGRFLLSRDKITIFQALAQAGDIGVYGDRSKIRILRETEEGTVIKTFDVRSADIIHSEFYYVEPNDVIYIQNVTEEVFGITSFTSLLSTILLTISSVVSIYVLIKN